MMTPMRYHPVPGSAPWRRATFGFDHVMRDPDYAQFPAWYEATRLIPVLGRPDVEHLFSQPEIREAA